MVYLAELSQHHSSEVPSMLFQSQSRYPLFLQICTRKMVVKIIFLEFGSQIALVLSVTSKMSF